MKTVNATRFKAECLAILDDVAHEGQPVTITKRGKPVARLVTAAGAAEKTPQETLLGTVEILGDIISPVLPPDAWEADGARR
jgi:prevent-host-death family protein